MVVTVTLNPSLDKSGVIPGLVYDDVLRVRDMEFMAGGKGVNVSRVLGNFGIRNIALGFAGGSAGNEFLKMVRSERIRNDFVRVRNATRTNWTLLDEEKQSVIKLNEPGPEIDAGEAERFLKKMNRYINRNNIFVITGSLPEGLNNVYYEEILSRLTGKTKAVFWDSEIIPKNNKPDFMKPNIYEAERMLKTRIKNDKDMVRALKAMKKYAHYPFISAGPKGLYFEDITGGFVRLQTPKFEHYAIPGAGDSFTAGFCAGYLKDRTFMDSVRLGTACAAATVGNARFANPEDAEKMMGRITVVRIRER